MTNEKCLMSNGDTINEYIQYTELDKNKKAKELSTRGYGRAKIQ